MTSDLKVPEQRGVDARQEELSRKLDSIGWALFLIWVGIAVLADIGWGWGLIGVATIILGATGVRWAWHLPIGGLWIALGLMFLAGGLWELFRVPWPLIPILIIACGLAVLGSVLRGRHAVSK